jgi:phosphonate transport system substrate-binding protein
MRTAHAQKALTFGVVPQQSAAELARDWIPVINLVAERAGLQMRFATAPNIPTFEKRLASGEYDIAYMNPYHYTVFNQKPGYKAFAKEKGRKLRGVVVVRKDSPIKDLTELAGREVAFPAPASFAATVLVRAELERKAIPITPRFVGSHESVYLNVMKGAMPAGGGIVRTLQTMEPAVKDGLRVLWSTKEYTPHAFANHPRIPAQAVAAIKSAMLAVDSDARGRLVLQGIGFNGIEAAQDSDWAEVRALGIDTLAALLRD